MTERAFNTRTEAHEARVGEVTLLFHPETAGSEFVHAYVDLRGAQQRLAVNGGSDVTAEVLEALGESLKAFIRRFLLPESVDAFNEARWPERVYTQMVEYLAEVYGGGSNGRPSWAVFRLVLSVAEDWDAFVGAQLAKGVDPRGWDLNGLLAVVEHMLYSGEEKDAVKNRREIYAVPRGVQQTQAAAQATGMQASDVNAMLAMMAQEDALYGG